MPETDGIISPLNIAANEIKKNKNKRLKSSYNDKQKKIKIYIIKHPIMPIFIILILSNSLIIPDVSDPTIKPKETKKLKKPNSKELRFFKVIAKSGMIIIAKK